MPGLEATSSAPDQRALAATSAPDSCTSSRPTSDCRARTTFTPSTPRESQPGSPLSREESDLCFNHACNHAAQENLGRVKYKGQNRDSIKTGGFVNQRDRPVTLDNRRNHAGSQSSVCGVQQQEPSVEVDRLQAH